MKKIIFLWAVFIFFFTNSYAYQVGGNAKANFGAQQEEQPSQQAAESAAKVRSFTNYGSRQNWSKGVQTKPVQTSLAGEKTTQFKPVSTDVKSAKVASAVAGSAAGQAASPAPVPTQASTQTAAAAANAPEMAQAMAALQQLQGLQNRALNGAKPGEAANANSAGAASPLPAGMPDISSLLNAAGGNTPGGSVPGGKSK